MPGEPSLGSPTTATMLLSPVLSRPVRSQSAHSPAPFFIARSASACSCVQPPSASFVSDSDGDGGTAVVPTRARLLSRGSVVGARKKLSHCYCSGEESPLAGTPPPLCHSPTVGLKHSRSSYGGYCSASAQLHSLPGSGSFSRSSYHHHGWANSSGGHATIGLSTYGGASGSGGRIRHRYCKYYHKRGSVSQHDSFDSATGSEKGSASLFPVVAGVATTSGGGAIAARTKNLASAQQQQQRSSQAFALPQSAASSVFLQRSHSDAQELKHYRPQQQQQQQAQLPQHKHSCCWGATSLGGGRKQTLDNSQLTAGSSSAAALAAAASKKLDELHLNRIRRMRRKATHSIRTGSNTDGLNSSLESNSSALPSYYSLSTTTIHHQPAGGALFGSASLLTTSAAAAASSSFSSTVAGGAAHSSLMRLRHCPLGHSDPQLYTLSTSAHAAHTHHHSPHYSPHAQYRSPKSGGLLGYASNAGAPSPAHSTESAGGGAARRSFLSASPLTSSRFRKDSVWLTSPRQSIGGGSTAGSGARRRLEMFQSSPHGSGSSLMDRRHSARRSIGGESTTTSVAAAAAASMLGRQRIRSSTGAAHHLLPSTSGGALRHPVALRAAAGGGGSNSLAAPSNKDNRRWSLASLPSSSGYGTPGSNSAFSSQYSSEEHLAELLMDMRFGAAQNHFDSNENYPCFDLEAPPFGMRPRSRSLTSPMRAGSEYVRDGTPQVLNSVYKERFPKAKSQMESRLQQFLVLNAPLSGFTSSAALNLNLEAAAVAGCGSNPNVNDSAASLNASAAGAAPTHAATATPTGASVNASATLSSARKVSGAQQLSSSAGNAPKRTHSRSASPRPTSPLPPRPISPLAIGSATASADGVVFRSISPAPPSQTQLQSRNLSADGYNNYASIDEQQQLFAQRKLTLSPATSSLCIANLQQPPEVASAALSARINPALAAAQIPGYGSGGGGSTTSNNSGSAASGSLSMLTVSAANRSHRSSFMIAAPGEQLTPSEQSLLRLISDGATRFLHHQLCEICVDCLLKSRDDVLTCAYFCNMSVRLDETLAEAEMKVGPESYKYLAGLVRQILMIVSRTARLLECLEFNPDEFYQLLEEAEGTVREQLGCGSARVPDLPQYIIGKLGLNKNLLIDQPINDADVADDVATDAIDDEILAVTANAQASFLQRRRASQLGDDTSALGGLAEKLSSQDDAKLDAVAEHVGSTSMARAAPREEDFETIRLISNGAYGAVYLVRQRQTRQRFALKKMKKQTLLLRNQVEQVYAERDILTFTDNPFVVCFYGSFETRQHLCMLMEYVEGGDCAALLKSAGTLPIELARLYVAETVLAIEYLHSCGIVHRDLKPDNLLITTMGHIKLTDFGLSKIGLMNRTTLVSEGYLDDTQQFKDNQLCGTPEYIAPCVILRQGYGKPVDWWALGVILYEFLIGVVPFMAETPEDLFANIINEEVEYPEGDEALDPNAESLIRMLLEKNPMDRLGTMSGASEVAAHPFFASLDFDTLLRQKAEFVPQLENDEDTSYFDSREDRYNHEADSGDDENAPMFWSFNTASPRHSIVGMELPSGTLAGLQALAESSGAGSTSLLDEPSTGGGGRQSAFSAVGRPTNDLLDARDSFENIGGHLPPSSGSVGAKSLENQPIPSAVILRRRFSAARHANLSTSSSGTTTGTAPTANTNSSTDSSMDAAHFAAIGMESSYGGGGGVAKRHNTLAAPLPRLAISPCAEMTQQQQSQPSGILARRATVSTTYSGNGDYGSNSGASSSFSVPQTLAASTTMTELSPVEETTAASSAHSISGLLSASTDETIPPRGYSDYASKQSTRTSMDKRPSTVAHALLTNVPTNLNDSLSLDRSVRSASCRSNSLRVMIPQQQQQSTSNASSPSQPQQQSQHGTSVSTSYYHSYGVAASSLSGGQLSPSSCRSASSISSFDGGGGGANSPNQYALSANSSEAPPTFVAGSLSASSTSVKPADGVNQTTSSSVLPPLDQTTKEAGNNKAASSTTLQNLPLPPTIQHPQHQQQQSKAIVIRKGAHGYGFTIRSVRVYLSEVSEYYSIEHIVAAVREHSPAFEAGLRENDLITHIHTQSVHNLSHPQLMHRLLSCGNEITLHVTPLNSTSIKEGEARRNVGKLLRKKPRRPGAPSGTSGARRNGMEKKPRKASTLLRRLSGKRTAGDIVPGTSSQKQTFMPRSVSSQDGALAVSPAVGGATSTKSGKYLTTADANISYTTQPLSTITSPATATAPRSPVAPTSADLKHHSSFKGGTQTQKQQQQQVEPVTASAFHQKRLSDFGIGFSASSSSPMTSTTNSSLGSGDFLHLQPMVAHHHHHHQQQPQQQYQSPLVASSKSAPLPPVQKDGHQAISNAPKDQQQQQPTSPTLRNFSDAENVRKKLDETSARKPTPIRPSTLIQSPSSAVTKPAKSSFLLPALPQRGSGGVELTNTVTGNTLQMPAATAAAAPIGASTRTMPLSPLARQSSSSSTLAAAVVAQQQQQPVMLSAFTAAAPRMTEFSASCVTIASATDRQPVSSLASSPSSAAKEGAKSSPTNVIVQIDDSKPEDQKLAALPKSAIISASPTKPTSGKKLSLNVGGGEQSKSKSTAADQQNRSPSPSRKISPSRIIHRLFCVGSQASASSSTTPPIRQQQQSATEKNQ